MLQSGQNQDFCVKKRFLFQNYCLLASAVPIDFFQMNSLQQLFLGQKTMKISDKFFYYTSASQQWHEIGAYLQFTMQHPPTRPREYFTKPSDLGLAIEFIAIKRLWVFSQKMSKLGVKNYSKTAMPWRKLQKCTHAHALHLYIIDYMQAIDT